MRKTITFKIEGHEGNYEVKELTIGEIMGLMQNDLLQGKDIDSLKTIFADKLMPMCTNIQYADLQTFSPSEMKEVYLKFKEVNSVFFDLAQTLGQTGIVKELLVDLRKAAIADFGKLFATLQNPDTLTS